MKAQWNVKATEGLKQVGNLNVPANPTHIYQQRAEASLAQGV